MRALSSAERSGSCDRLRGTRRSSRSLVALSVFLFHLRLCLANPGGVIAHSREIIPPPFSGRHLPYGHDEKRRGSPEAEPDRQRVALARDGYALVKCEHAVFKPEA